MSGPLLDAHGNSLEHPALTDLDALEKLLQTAWPLSWMVDADKTEYVLDARWGCVATAHDSKTAALIVAAVNALPGLIAELREARERARRTCENCAGHVAERVSETELADWCRELSCDDNTVYCKNVKFCGEWREKQA